MEIFQHLIQYLLHVIQYILNIDTYLFSFVDHYGFLTYLILFAVIFCETGLIIIPFLPGDSLIFAAGSIAANTDQVLSIQLLFLLLTCASILGNKVNYFIGRMIGPKIFSSKASNTWYGFFVNQKHVDRAHRFYEKHGGKTIIFARFIPIIRTFAPFIAGVASMSLPNFSIYNIVSGILWIGSLLSFGYFFGNLPFIKEHFSIVIYCVIAFSLLPPALAFLFRRA